ncbi:hypothetical protein Fmac_005237 [Flemingia macrophylla]|uniref:Uncharacterized protein n=1 Tax=Flemingia macrophylla TaxID=520843 RepID=A0ABD1N876_9FABA
MALHKTLVDSVYSKDSALSEVREALNAAFSKLEACENEKAHLSAESTSGGDVAEPRHEKLRRRRRIASKRKENNSTCGVLDVRATCVEGEEESGD